MEKILISLRNSNNIESIKSSITTIRNLDKESTKRTFILMLISLFVITPMAIDYSTINANIKIFNITLPDLKTTHAIISLYYPFIFGYMTSKILSFCPLIEIQEKLIDILIFHNKYDTDIATNGLYTAPASLSFAPDTIGNENKFISTIKLIQYIIILLTVTVIPAFAIHCSIQYSKTILSDKFQNYYITAASLIFAYATISTIATIICQIRISEDIEKIPSVISEPKEAYKYKTINITTRKPIIRHTFTPSPQTPASPPDHPDTKQPE